MMPQTSFKESKFTSTKIHKKAKKSENPEDDDTQDIDADDLTFSFKPKNSDAKNVE